MTQLKKFSIKGLHYYQDFDIDFDLRANVLVGENGIGKTTILSSLYYLLTQEWYSLLTNAFEYIRLDFDNRVVEFSHAELEAEYINQGLIKPSFRSTNFHEIIQSLNTIDQKRIIYFPSFRNIIEEFGEALGIADSDQESGANRRLSKFLTTFLRRYRDEQASVETFKRNLVATDNESFKNILRGQPFEALVQFQEVCNRYLFTTKLLFDAKEGTLQILNKNNSDIVSLELMSSGEKQIIHIMSRIFLTGREGLLVFFDEPEISLSINWQRTILPDILNSGNCSFLLAATHSPFIFSNEFEACTTGIKSHITTYGR